MEFVDRLFQAVKSKGTPLCVGFDPHIGLIPKELVTAHLAKASDPWAGWAAAVETFFLRILDRIAPLVPVIKPQWAFFEQFGPAGIAALQRIVNEAALRGVLIISDAKRGDIGSTAEAYANVFFHSPNGAEPLLPPPVPSDAVTLNPYLGEDSIRPFLQKNAKHGVFILVRTSNQSGDEFQNLPTGTQRVMETVAEHVDRWGAARIGECGWSSVGAVVGATYPHEAIGLRKIMPRTPFLIPGFGAQGGQAADAVVALHADGTGGVINSSRDILFAYRKPPYSSAFGPDAFDRAAEAACRDAIGVIDKALKSKL